MREIEIKAYNIIVNGSRFLLVYDRTQAETIARNYNGTVQEIIAKQLVTEKEYRKFFRD